LANVTDGRPAGIGVDHATRLAVELRRSGLAA